MNEILDYKDCEPKRLGCYVDKDLDHDLPYRPGISSLQRYTPTECNKLCKGYRYLGLQKNGTCSCGNDFGKYGNTDNRVCGNIGSNSNGQLINTIWETCGNKGKKNLCLSITKIRMEKNVYDYLVKYVNFIVQFQRGR